MTEEEFDKIRRAYWNLYDVYHAAEKVILEERRKRVPQFGDLVRCTCGGLGRFIGEGKALYAERVERKGVWSTALTVEPVNMEEDWRNFGNQKLFPTDEDLEKYKK